MRRNVKQSKSRVSC